MRTTTPDRTALTDAASAVARTTLTLGAEEEFLLLDPGTGHNVPVAGEVRAALPDELRGYSRTEFRHSMVEMVTSVCTDLSELRRQLWQRRSATAAAAAASGARLVAVGATPVAEPDLSIPDIARFEAIGRHYGPIAHDPAVCGLHVHVGVPDRALAVEVCNHLRPWLPVIQALAVNSPLHAGADTGYASWRSIQLERWPSLGPSPHFASADDYDSVVATLVASGVMLDATMVLWYARPSASYPTVEVRVADVCPTVDDAVLVAGLIRALVATAVDGVADGLPAPPVSDGVLRAAHWNAAHRGLDGTLLDPRTSLARPAWDLVDDLVTAVGPALHHHGDHAMVTHQLARLREEGTGATRQRRLTGDIHAVLAHLADLTVAGGWYT